MERKFLKDLGLSEDAVENIMAENGRDIAAQKEKLAALETEREGLLGKLRGQELDAAVTAELFRAGAKNLKAARAMLKLDGAALKEDGTVEGLAEQLETLKTDPGTAFLFRSREMPRGFRPGEGRDGLPGEGEPESLREAVRSALFSPGH